MKRAMAVLVALIIVFAAVPLFASPGGSGNHYHFGWSRGNNPHGMTVTPPPSPPPVPIVGGGKVGGKKG